MDRRRDHPGLHREALRLELERAEAGHAAEVEDDAAVGSRPARVAGAGAAGNHGNAMPGTRRHDAGDLVGRLREDDRLGDPAQA